MVALEQIYTPVSVKVWGRLACFTRPEMKVERVSYEVMTPSAARGILEAVFWKPEFQWRVQEIHVLRPIRRISLLRNELKSKLAFSTVRKWATEDEHYFIEEDHTQRHTLALQNVAYTILADVHLRRHADAVDSAKYRDQFRRRVARGQCFQRPYLGCREFVADFAPPDGSETPISRTEDLGRMLFDMNYGTKGDRITPRFFQARLQEGVLHVPQRLYEEM